MIEFTAPIRIESEMNRREHWARRKKRFDAHKLAIACLWPKGAKFRPPVVVTLTRIGPRRLDDDNLASGFKAVRDQIAKMVGIDDGKRESIRFVYEQQRGKPKEYAAHVRVEGA
jgi:hypothetical protein